MTRYAYVGIFRRPNVDGVNSLAIVAYEDHSSGYGYRHHEFKDINPSLTNNQIRQRLIQGGLSATDANQAAIDYRAAVVFSEVNPSLADDQIHQRLTQSGLSASDANRALESFRATPGDTSYMEGISVLPTASTYRGLSPGR
jgi:hypothetical protein